MTEVKLSRINTNTYPSNPAWDRFYTLVEGSHGKWYSHLPEDDFKQLLEIYQRIPHEGLTLDPVNFVFAIDNRTYAEWCMSPGEGKGHWEKHNNYQGEGFTNFIANEVHYELERERSEKDRRSHVGYLKARERVLGGLALRAIELFTEWNGDRDPPCRIEKDEKEFNKYIHDDTRNLRELGEGGLNEYIIRYCNLKEHQAQTAVPVQATPQKISTFEPFHMH